MRQLDEIIVLRYLFDRDRATQKELSGVMQRSLQFGHNILSEMLRKQMIEPVDGLALNWRLTPVMRDDINYIFQADQYNFGFGNLYE